MPTGFMNHAHANRLAIRTRASLSRINWPLYLALLITAALPTIYTTTRIYYLGDLPTEWGVNIASQLARNCGRAVSSNGYATDMLGWGRILGTELPMYDAQADDRLNELLE